MTLSWKAPFRLSRALFRASLWFLSGRPVIAPKWAIKRREDTCRACKYNDHGPETDLGQCRACECVIHAKVLLSSESCPDGRWQSVGPKS